MNTIQTLITDLEKIRQSHLIDSLQILVSGRQVFKFRIYLASDLFVQGYRNDRFNTTNFALILGQQRIYGRDEYNGIWHRHPVSNPNLHDDSEAGRKPITLSAFWTEILETLNDLNLLE